MKTPKEVPPLRVQVKLRDNARKSPQLEWTTVQKLEDTVDLSEHKGWMAEVIKRLKQWIDRQIGADQQEIRMLRKLHKTHHLEIMVNDDEAARELEPIIKDYWVQRQTRHQRRMVLAGIAVLPALLLTVLPGPNIVGIPLAYLAWHHWRIVEGIKKIRSGTIDVELKKAPVVINDHEVADNVNEKSLSHETHQTADL